MEKKSLMDQQDNFLAAWDIHRQAIENGLAETIKSKYIKNGFNCPNNNLVYVNDSYKSFRQYKKYINVILFGQLSFIYGLIITTFQPIPDKNWISFLSHEICLIKAEELIGENILL